MTAPKITLYIDIVSPFAYIAFHVLRNDSVFRGCDITYEPIFLGGLMKMCDNRPPLAIKNKDKWINRERLRWANLFNVPISQTLPPGFPPMTLPAMRALAALQQLDGSGQNRLITALETLWHEMFVERTPVQEPGQLRRILAGALGGEAEADRILAAASSDSDDGGKKTLTRNTSAAFDTGAFGLPWLVCTRPDGETDAFWGVDHLAQVATFLGVEKPSTGAWKALL